MNGFSITNPIMSVPNGIKAVNSHKK